MSYHVDSRFTEKCGARATCRLFTGRAWADKNAELTECGFVNVTGTNWYEVTLQQAVGILSAALASDLCYGSRRMANSSAARMARQFLEQFPEQAQFFTNSAVPYHLRESAWQFDSITVGVVDTGILVKVGESLAGILWISDDD